MIVCNICSYSNICQYSSDFLSIVFMNVVIPVFKEMKHFYMQAVVLFVRLSTIDSWQLLWLTLACWNCRMEIKFFIINLGIAIWQQKNQVDSLKNPADSYYSPNINTFKQKERERGADVPFFETIKTNAGTQPKNELQQ